MTETDQGIIFRTRRLTETSLIVDWLALRSGRVSTVAKGALRPKSPFRGKLDLFYEADFAFVRSRRSGLHTLREIVLMETHSVLRRELGWLRQASYAVSLVEQMTEKDTPLPAIFQLMRRLLGTLSLLPPQPRLVLALEIKLLDECGLKPDLAGSKLTPGARQIAEALANQQWPAILRLRPSAAQTTELERFLHGFLLFHLGRIPKGRTAALSER